MINGVQRPTCAQVRQTDMVGYLSELGCQPYKIKENDYWYLSPLTLERTASFKINRKLNRWRDHGIGKGGNLPDFAVLYHNGTGAELLQNLEGKFSFYPASFYQPRPVRKENKIRVLKGFTISSVYLLKYLEERHISFKIADPFCREIRYQIGGKIFYAIGFKNRAGGYELRNPYCKNGTSPKEITTIINSSSKATVFEGFFDFLSFMVLQQNRLAMQWDFCILNSLSFFERARPFLEQYHSIHLFLDNDKAGQNCSLAALRLGEEYSDKSFFYAANKDLNVWLVQTRLVDIPDSKSIPP
jgi:hypothetical protein